MTSNSKRRKTDELISCGWNGCLEKFEDIWQLNTHIDEHLEEINLNGKTTYLCNWRSCKYSTKCLKQLHRHIYYHGYFEGLTMQGKQECIEDASLPLCKAPTMKDGDRIPELKNDFRCAWADCERSFASIVEFQDHIVQHASFDYEIQKSPDETRPKIHCNWNFCKKELDNKYRLIEHIKTHTNKKQVACHNCGELFRTRTTLFDHLRRQPGNNTQKYQCTHCFKLFATEKLLRAHVVKHVNCFKCSMCDMSCSSASSLATHVRYRHLKDKPFKCSECDHRSVRESDLAKHVSFVHRKEEHRCDQPGCSYAVRSYNLLRRHYLEVHSNSPFIYVCHCCDKPFKSGKTLSAHLVKKHGFQLPSGHKRFTYRVDEDGFYRLETKRIESLEVTKQILSPNPFEVSEMTQDSSCYEIVSMTNEQDARIIVSNDVAEAHLVGEVIISLPTLDELAI